MFTLLFMSDPNTGEAFQVMILIESMMSLSLMDSLCSTNVRPHLQSSGLAGIDVVDMSKSRAGFLKR